MASFDNENIFAYRSELADQTPLDSSLSEKDRYDIATRLAGSVGGFLSGSDIFNLYRDASGATYEALAKNPPVVDMPFMTSAIQPIDAPTEELPPYEDRLLTTEYFQKKLGGDPQNPVSMVGDILSMVTQPEVGVAKLAKFIGMFPFLKNIEKTSDKIYAIQTQQARRKAERVQDHPSGQAGKDLDDLIFALDGAEDELLEIQKAERQAEKTGLQQVTFDLDTASKAEKQKRIGELIQSQKNMTDPEEKRKVQEEVKRIGQSLNVRKAPDTKGLKVFEAQDKQFNDRVRSLTVEENLETTRFPESTASTIYEDQLRSPIIDSMVRAPQNLKGEQILEWASKNTKAKELEFTGLDNFIKNNPDATMDDAIKHVNENQVRITEDRRVFDSSGPTLEFESEISDMDPLDGIAPWDYRADDIRYEITSRADANFLRSEMVDLMKNENIIDDAAKSELYKLGDTDPQMFILKIDEILKPTEFNFGDIIQKLAKNEYYQNPYEMITASAAGRDFGPQTFAYGNDEVGYSIFVDGNRIDGGDVPYSRTEAEIQLRDAIQSEQGTDILRLQDEIDEFDGDELGQSFQQYIDKNLPGGENYREITFNWDNADDAHSFGHDELNQHGQAIAHALVRDRKLADGTRSLHIDETQSNLHQKGAKQGYKPPRAELQKAKDDIIEMLNNASSDNYKYREGYNPIAERKPRSVKFDLVNTETSSSPRINVIGVDADNVDFSNSFDEHDIRIISNLVKSFEKTHTKGVLARERFGDMAYDPEAIFRANDAIMTGRDLEKMDPEEILYDIFRDEKNKNVYGSREADMLVKVLGKDIHKLNDMMEPIRNSMSLVPNYPYKDDWHKMVLKKMILEAIQNGNEAISTSPAKLISDRYSDRYSEFYEILYDDKIPAEMKKLANKYGGKFEKDKLDLDDIYNLQPFDATLDPYGTGGERFDANILRITPEMKEKILAEGLEKFKDGGLVSGINVFEENTAPRIDNMKRLDGTNKSAQGFLGPIKNQITGKTHTELSTNFDDVLGGSLIPLLVPTLTQEEVNWFRKNNAEGNTSEVPQSIKQKAIRHAIMRVESGKSPFYQDNESTLDSINIFKTMDR